MRLNGIRWTVFGASLLITLAVLFAAGYLVRSRAVDEPLEALLTSSPVVQAHTTEHNGNLREIAVTLLPTPDLQGSYTGLDTGIRRILKDAPYDLVVKDRRDPALTEALSRMNLYVQEALVTGHFADMAQRIEADAVRGGATARVSVDTDRVYLQMSRGSDYLYSVTERPKPPAPVGTQGGLGL